MIRLTVGIVGVVGERVAKEQRLVEGLGLGDLDGLSKLSAPDSRAWVIFWTYRARGTQVLPERLSGLHGGERTGLATVIGEGLDVNVGVAVVDNDGLLGGGQAHEGGGGE